MFCMHNPVMFIDPLGLFAVMAYYIAKKNDGTFTSTTSQGNITGVTIQIGDITRTFSSSDITYSMGHILMEHSLLMQEFGLTRLQATHQPWDRFGSMDSAAIAFSLMHTARSTAMHREIGAIIYSVRTGFGGNARTHYTFGNPWVGGEYDVAWGLVGRVLSSVAGGEVGRPLRSSMAALAHTHLEEWNWFSQEDMNIAHGTYNIHGIGIPAMPVFMSLNMGAGMEVRRYDSTMNRNRFGRLILSI